MSGEVYPVLYVGPYPDGILKTDTYRWTVEVCGDATYLLYEDGRRERYTGGIDLEFVNDRTCDRSSSNPDAWVCRTDNPFKAEGKGE
jgi:hypothetical protein